MTNNIITIILLTGVYLIGITTIFGSINPFAEKDCGGLKGKILKLGYYKLGILPTNLLGLSINGLLQVLFLVVVSPIFLLGFCIMPFSYYVSMKFFKTTEVAEYMNGCLWGCLILAAVIGG